MSAVTEYKEPEAKPKFLEDLPPKFEDSGETEDPRTAPQYANIMSQLKLSDFTPQRFLNMPCFREAMMTGFQAMAVLGGVTFLIHKKPNKSVNWGVCGFFLGNIIGWEQCRSIRRKSFETMEKARKAKQEKQEQRTQEELAAREKEKQERAGLWSRVQAYYRK